MSVGQADPKVVKLLFSSPYLLVTGLQLCTVVAILLGVGHYLTVEYLKMVIDGAIPLWAGLGACSFFKC
jgi:hypothetical protein